MVCQIITIAWNFLLNHRLAGLGADNRVVEDVGTSDTLEQQVSAMARDAEAFASEAAVLSWNGPGPQAC